MPRGAHARPRSTNCSNPSATSAPAPACPTGRSASTRMWPWERYQLAGLRISSDRAFTTVAIPQYGVVTDAAHNIDLRNFRNAADWAAEGYRRRRLSRPALPVHRHIHFGSATPKLPIFDGDHALEMNYVAHALRKLYLEHDNALYPAAIIHAGVYRNFCVMNLLTMLDERNLNQAFVTGLIANAVFVPTHHAGRGAEQQLRDHRQRLRGRVPANGLHRRHVRGRLLHGRPARGRLLRPLGRSPGARPAPGPR